MSPLAAFAMFGLLAAQLPQAAPLIAPRAVMVGGEAEMDACGSVGQVIGLKTKGDNFLSVRAAPNVKGAQLAKLGPKTRVYICEESADRAWFGIVFEDSGGGGLAGDGCDVTSPIAVRQKYRGACPSGWVSAKFIEIIAG